MPNKKKLTILQERFVGEMVNPATKNRTQAAINAGFAKSHARQTAAKLITTPSIANAIEEKKSELAKLSLIGAKFVTGGIVKLALDGESDAVKLGAYKLLATFLGMEKKPAENPNTIELNKEKSEALIKLWMERDGLSREQAVAVLHKLESELSQWTN